MERFCNTYVEIFGHKPGSILEIGSRDGNDAETLRGLSKASSSNVFVVEPHPQSFKNIINKYPNFRAFELVVSDIPGVVDFNAIPWSYGEAEVGNSSLLRKDSAVLEKVTGVKTHGPENWMKVLAVTGKTILKLINRPEIDVVKIDVEGHTFEVLKSFENDIRLLKMLHLEVELSQIWEKQHLFNEIKPYLRFFGFEEMYYIPQYYNGDQGDSVWRRL